jgi:cystathionine beta-lyase/cystathionine gamma-synthase
MINESLVLSNLPKIPNHYNRSYSDHQDNLTTTLKHQYGVKNCVVTTSGMNAISSICHAILIENSFEPVTIVCSNELYCDTPRLFWFLKAHYNCVDDIIQVDIRNPDTILAAFTNLKNKTVIFHTETCSNPNGFVFDCSLLNVMKTMAKKMYTILDNTWLTHVIFNPFTVCSTDNLFVVASLTKYYSGGTALGGVILCDGNNSVMDRCLDWIKHMGIHISPHNCMLINNMAQTMNTRIKASSELTILVANYLKNINKVYIVNHPVFENQHFNGIYPSVLTFCVKNSKSKVLKVLSAQQLLDYKTSFGSAKSKVDPWPQIVKHGNDTFVRIRLAIGFDDDFERIKNGIDNIINCV